jgi:hypothetical protein
MAATDLQAKIDALTAEVATDTTVEQSAETLLTGLSALIAGLKTGVTDPAQLAAIDALTATLTTNRTGLAASIVSNTPAA